MSEKTAVEQAIERIKKFCVEWRKMPRNDQEEIYNLHYGDERQASLLIADLEELTTLRASGDVDVEALKREVREHMGEGYNGHYYAGADIAVSYLASRNLLSRESAWRPIESALTDGTPIILAHIARTNVKQDWEIVWACMASYKTTTLGYIQCAAYSDFNAHLPCIIDMAIKGKETNVSGFIGGDNFPPTHWMPLPAPPLGDKL